MEEEVKADLEQLAEEAADSFDEDPGDPEPEYDHDDGGDDGPTEYGGSVDGEYDEFRKHINAIGFEYEAHGSFRDTYIRGKVVIKIPRNGDGVRDNRTEAKAWHIYKSSPTPKGYLLAPCRLLSNDCLMMVRVNVHGVDWESGTRPPWTSRIEGGQVGIYRGQVVAYDFALNIPERAVWEDEEWGESEWFNENGYVKNDYC